LSRCLLELLNDDKMLQSAAADSALSAATAIAKAMWKDDSALDGRLSKLHGISIELLGRFLCHGQTDKIDLPWLLSCLERLLEPANDFRLRYSAAFVTKSLLQNLPLIESHDLASVLISLWIAATQDGHVDVRFAAAGGSHHSARSLIPEVTLYNLAESLEKRFILSAIKHVVNAPGFLLVEEETSPDKIFTVRLHFLWRRTYTCSLCVRVCVCVCVCVCVFFLGRKAKLV
jgi:hypothetical protein